MFFRGSLLSYRFPETSFIALHKLSVIRNGIMHSVRIQFLSLPLLLSFLLFFLSSCRSALPPHIMEMAPHPSPSSDKIPVIFVPGIKGSRLVDSEGEIQWLTGSQALGFSNSDLRLKRQENPESQASVNDESPDELMPYGPVDRVTAIPYLLDVAVYDGWLRTMSENPEVDFYVFSYDWRIDNTLTRSKLLKYIQKIASQYKQKPVLIGHSMGGMLSFSVVNYNPNLVSGAVYVGTPFRGGIGYMRDLYEGTSTGLNSEIQSPCTIARYGSVYGFFPRLDTWDTKNVVLDKEGKSIPIDFFQAQQWEEYNLGFHAHYCKPEEIPNPVEFNRMLKLALYFRKSLDPTASLVKNPPPSLVVTAKNRKTTEKMQISQPKTGAGSKIIWDLDRAPKAPGDGRVTEGNSLPPKGFPYKKIYTEYEHSVMLNDTGVQEAILEFIDSSQREKSNPGN